MKDWKLYTARASEYMRARWTEDEKEKRTKVIGAQKLTDDERAAAILEMFREVNHESREIHVRELQISKELEEDFWVDAREELQYPSFLNEEGCNLLEKAAKDSVAEVEFGAEFVRIEHMFRDLAKRVEFAKQVIECSIGG